MNILYINLKGCASLSPELVSNDYTVISVHTGRQVVSYLSEYAEHIKLIFIELCASAEVLIEQLVNYWPDIKIVALVEDADNSRIIDAIKAGATDFITKPLKKELIELAIRELSSRSLEKHH